MGVYMKFAYADPPYLGKGKKYVELHDEALIWDDPMTHIKLLEQLMDEYPDGWAVSFDAVSLRLYLSNSHPDSRLCVWTKTFHQIWWHQPVQWATEYVLLYGGRKNQRVNPMVRDWHSGARAMKAGLYGAKPDHFNQWILDLLQYEPGDQLDDLFPGTHSMAKAIASRHAV